MDVAGLSHEQNMAKMRLLTFMGMAVEFKEISFHTMQQELQIGPEDVEAFVIDGASSPLRPPHLPAFYALFFLTSSQLSVQAPSVRPDAAVSVSENRMCLWTGFSGTAPAGAFFN